MPLFSGYFSIASFLPKLQDLGSHASEPEWLEGHYSSGSLLVRFTLKLKNRLEKKKSNTELKTKPSCRGPQGAAVGGETFQVDLRQSGSWASQCCHELPSFCLSSHCPTTEPLPRQLGFLISTGSTGIFTFSLLDSCGFQGIQVFAMSQEIHITSQAVFRPECAAAAWSPPCSNSCQASASEGMCFISMRAPGSKLQPLRQTSPCMEAVFQQASPLAFVPVSSASRQEGFHCFLPSIKRNRV